MWGPIQILEEVTKEKVVRGIQISLTSILQNKIRNKTDMNTLYY